LDALIIGAGAVGLAIARRLAMDGLDVIIVERADRHGQGMSSRSSEVIHSGIYYLPGSLKANLCVEGARSLYAYCQTHRIPARRCGKLIVAQTLEEVARLETLQAQADANGVPRPTLLDGAAAKRLEPALECAAALHVPSTGIFERAAYVEQLLADATGAGALIAYRTTVDSLAADGVDPKVVFKDVSIAPLTAKWVINAAGLDAVRLAATCGPAPELYLAKGSYFSLVGTAPFSRLIYPLPEVGGFGIHLTLNIAGAARFGPDVKWIERQDLTVDVSRRSAFAAVVRRYWPHLDETRLVPAHAGIRPKLSCLGPTDFLFHRTGRIISLLGIASPGLTASLAIGDRVSRVVNSRR
jgi:L-2-hydroxyglutarate oxidase LhgO